MVSNEAYNQSRPDVVVMAITSQFSSMLSVGDTLIADWPGAGLLKPSAIKPVFATVQKDLIIRSLGSLNQTDVLALRNAIDSVIG